MNANGTAVLYHQIKDDLVRAADKSVAAKEKRYHKYQGFCSFGITAPTFARILRGYKKPISELSRKDARG